MSETPEEVARGLCPLNSHPTTTWAPSTGCHCKSIASAIRAERTDNHALRVLINDLVHLLADSRDHTMKLAMVHGYDLDDADSFRLNTRVNEMLPRVKEAVAPLAEQAKSAPRPRS